MQAAAAATATAAAATAHRITAASLFLPPVSPVSDMMAVRARGIAYRLATTIMDPFLQDSAHLLSAAAFFSVAADASSNGPLDDPAPPVHVYDR